MGVLQAAKRLRDQMDGLAFSVAYVYNPLHYAWEPHAEYARRFGAGKGRRGLFVGMNPGPNGMGQTGVPFGDVAYVRDWMGIGGKVGQPPRTHPKRPVLGFATRRREPSGSRLYGWAQEQYGTAERFFADFYVVNYCPLLFFDEEGRNLTPPQLRKADTDALYSRCDEHLVGVVRALEPAHLIGVGKFAEARIQAACEKAGIVLPVGSVPHPSPANPAANKGWSKLAQESLRRMGVC